MTQSQIIKNEIPIEYITDLLNVLCDKHNDYLIFNIISYNKGVFNNLVNEFIEKCKPYYYKSKIKYLERTMNYNKFTTILRQILNYKNICFTSKINYDKSSYNIIYHIFI
jgi:hypothetical protein